MGFPSGFKSVNMNPKIISIPSSIKINDANIINCPYCNELLVKEVKTKSDLIDKCTDCFDRDKSDFPSQSYSYDDHINRNVPCKCEYELKDVLYITCQKCIHPKCISCDNLINNLSVKNCNECIKKQNKSEFNANFSTSTIEEKLKLHGIKKLNILAKKKNIPSYSTFNKATLITKLIPLTHHNDFPIIL